MLKCHYLDVLRSFFKRKANGTRQTCNNSLFFTTVKLKWNLHQHLERKYPSLIHLKLFTLSENIGVDNDIVISAEMRHEFGIYVHESLRIPDASK